MENSKLDKIKADIKTTQISVIKQAVKQTFEKLEALEKEKNDVQNRIKILKHDLFDLKDGRLDRILERQSMDDETRTISVVLVAKVPGVAGQNNSSPWYEEYKVSVLSDNGVVDCNINNSITKTNASGSYKLNDGSIRYL